MKKILLILIIFISFHVQAKRIHIVIDNAKLKKTYISIPNFKNIKGESSLTKIGKELKEIIQADLAFTDVFDFIESKNELIGYEPSKISFPDWITLGTEFLIAGGYKKEAEDIIFDVRLYDVKTAEPILAKKYTAKEKDIRNLAHRFTDDVFYELTNEKGISQTKIVFVSDKSKHKELYVMDYDGYNIQQLTFHKSLVMSPAWSSDGKKVSYSNYVKDKKHVRNMNLFVLTLESGKSTMISNKMGMNSGSSWSPNGKKIALTMSFEGNPELYMMNSSDGEEVERLTTHHALDVEPAWSPDGKSLIFSSGRASLAHLYTLDLESREIKRLTYAGQFNAAPSWSIKNKIAFAAQLQSHFDIFVLNANGTNLQRLTEAENRKNNEHPSWSPNGRHIVFSSNRSGKYGLYAMNEDGSNEKSLLENFGNVTVPAWSSFFE